MKRIPDRLALCLSVSALLFAAGAYISNRYDVGLALAALGVAACLTMVKLHPTRGDSVSYTDYVRGMLLEGKACSNTYLEAIYPPKERKNESEYVSPDGTLVLNAFGYGKTGEEWAANIYRTHKDGAKSMVVFTAEIDRKALAILGLVSDRVKPIHPRELYRKLYKQHVPMRTVPKRKFAWREIPYSLSYRQAGLFAMAAAGSTMLSIWMPIKIYYYVMAAVNALLALATLIIKRRVQIQ